MPSGGKGPTAEKTRSSRDSHRRQDTHQGQRSSGSSRQNPRSDQSGQEPPLEEQHQDFEEAVYDEPYYSIGGGAPAQYPAYDSASQQAGNQYGSTPTEYEAPKPRPKTKDSSSSSRSKKSSEPGKSTSSKSAGARTSRTATQGTATQAQLPAGEYYAQGYENSGSEYQQAQYPGTTGLETDFSNWNLEDPSAYSGEGWEGSNQVPPTIAEEVEAGDDGGAHPETVGYADQELVRGGVSTTGLKPWEVRIKVLTRKDKWWGPALGLIDTGNRVGHMILSRTLFSMGYSLSDIDARSMIEFATITGRAKTAGLIKLQYRYESDNQSHQETFHILTDSQIKEYDAYLAMPGGTFATRAGQTIPSISAFSSSIRELTKEERKEQMELLSMQHKGAKQVRDKAQESQSKHESRSGGKTRHSSSRQPKGDNQTSASYQYGSSGYEQPNSMPTYSDYGSMTAGSATHAPPEYATQYSQVGQGSFYPDTGFEHGMYQQEGYQQVSYQQDQQVTYPQTEYPEQNYPPGDNAETGYEAAQSQPQAGYGRGSQQPADYPQDTYPASSYGYSDQTTGGSRGRSSYEQPQDQERRSGGGGSSKKQSSSRRDKR